MNVLSEILEWSKERNGWQRDALRRLVLTGDLSDDDIIELAAICKSAHGLAEQQAVAPLAEEHVPSETVGAMPVSLVSIFHHRGVNALADDQTLKFSPNLTVVYGDNAAGKTGYIRILKSACRARGQETILGNVVSGSTPFSPVVSIKYQIGDELDPHEWSGDGEDKFISRVSVFDTQCAAIYLTEKTDVAFRPFGLDLFDKLVKASKAVRAILENERRALDSNALATVQAKIPPGTVVSNFLGNISSLTKPESVEELARLSQKEEARLALLDKSLHDLKANDPEKLARQLTLRAGRVQALARHLNEVETVLSRQAVTVVFEARNEGQRKSIEAKRLREATFSAGLLAGTGSESWKVLWEAARRFSEEQAYPGQDFPVLESGAACVLCQQDLAHGAGNRLRQFQAFIASTTERELQLARETFARLRMPFIELKIVTESATETVKEIRIEHPDLADRIDAALDINEKRRTVIIHSLAEGKDITENCPDIVSISKEVHDLIVQITERIKTLSVTTNEENLARMIKEAQELRSRKILAQHKLTVLGDIERRMKYAAYGLCIDETKTQAITQKSTTVTKVAVSQRLTQSFKNELVNLAFRHVEVELKEAGGTEGVLYHKLVLTRAPGVQLPKVVSEGEQRCLSIAAFFAELSTADDPSGIVFDDPVSSLDYRWREGVARRLAQEAKTRQVIVFTHDVVFLLLLKQFAKELGVMQLDQHVRHLSKGSGICTDELPWVAMPVKKKIGYLKNEWQSADKLFRDGHQAAYEKEAAYLYGLLREAWERALEEILLGGIVERFRPSVQTQQIGLIADITHDECRAFDAAMGKCSKWLPGHDQAPAARAPVPDPAVLKADIETLESFVTAIHKRRSKV